MCSIPIFDCLTNFPTVTIMFKAEFVIKITKKTVSFAQFIKYDTKKRC